MVIRLGRQDIDVAARRRQFRAVKQQQPVRDIFRVGPGVLGRRATDMHVVIRYHQIVEAQPLGKADDPRLRIVGGIGAVPTMHVPIALEPHAN
ncbi:hypothetical protein D3C87_1771750 [compost metagenome]